MPISLRQELDQITLEKDVSKHPALVTSLKSRIHHTVYPLQSEVNLSRYTCAVYAFDLVENPTYETIASHGTGRTFAGCDFVEFLISEERLERNQRGNLAIYFESGRFKHVAKVVGHDRLVSKWGIGHLWEHDFWEVPESYGSELTVYQITAGRSGVDLFLDYAKSKGWTLGPASV